MRRAGLLAAALAPLLLLGHGLAGGAAPSVSRWVMAGGGGRATVAQVELRATIGQSLVGRAMVGSRRVCAGFWCGGQSTTRLPVIFKSHN